MVPHLKNIDVFILCGGRGKRLSRVCRSLPKPMVSIGGRPFLDIIINYMAGFGFRRFILGIGYKAEVVRDYYQKNKIPGVSILFSKEKNALDTGGAVKKASCLIKTNPFFVLNGDSFCKFNPLDFLEFHLRKKSLVSLLLRRVSDGREYGEVLIDGQSRIKTFKEKEGKAGGCLINSGIYIFDRRTLVLMPAVPKFSLEYYFFPEMVTRGIFGYVNSGFFIDVGTPRRYLWAQKYFLKNNNLMQ